MRHTNGPGTARHQHQHQHQHQASEDGASSLGAPLAGGRPAGGGPMVAPHSVGSRARNWRGTGEGPGAMAARVLLLLLALSVATTLGLWLGRTAWRATDALLRQPQWGPDDLPEMLMVPLLAAGAAAAAWYALTALAGLLLTLTRPVGTGSAVHGRLMWLIVQAGAPAVRRVAVAGAVTGMSIGLTLAPATASVPAPGDEPTSEGSGSGSSSGPSLIEEPRRATDLPVVPGLGPVLAGPDNHSAGPFPPLGGAPPPPGHNAEQPTDRAPGHAETGTYRTDDERPTHGPDDSGAGPPSSPTGADEHAAVDDRSGADESAPDSGRGGVAIPALPAVPALPGSAAPRAPELVDTPAYPEGSEAFGDAEGTEDAGSPPSAGTSSSAQEDERSGAEPASPGPEQAAPTDGAAEEAVTYVVAPGDSLWAIAAAHLGDGSSARDIALAWPDWYATNSDLIGSDPDLLRVGTRLTQPEVTTVSTAAPDQTTTEDNR